MVRDAGSQHNDRLWERNDNNRRSLMVKNANNNRGNKG
jgi:hypothetical protein